MNTDKTEKIKSNLRDYYNQEAELRNAGEKPDWKINEQKAFIGLALREHKKRLLEIGAGTGHDSKYFMEHGFEVTAIDLSAEMVKKCKEKGIDAYEMDFYNLSALNKKFDCIWAMNTLLHVPKSDLHQVLKGIDAVLNEDGLFFMGVWGGKDTEHDWSGHSALVDKPRFFSFHSEEKLKETLREVFDIISFKQYDVDRENFDFQAVVMRKKQT
ncbi:MAG: class I SAM-dependent methyltransferase [Defluviitaleaceae bacterium]|nr:class I SAM-dependent methyltransferase [Defluviitaleaceae bacterium]